MDYQSYYQSEFQSGYQTEPDEAPVSLEYGIITISELKTYLDIEDTTDDDRLQSVIVAVTDFFETECNRKFESRDYTEYYNGDGGNELFLNQFPINSSSDEIEIYTSISVPRDYTDNQISSDYIVIESKIGLIHLISDYFPKGTQTVKVVYNAGYETIPYDLKRAALELGALMWSKEKNQIDIISTYSIQGSNITIQADKAFNKFCESVIEKYRRVEY
jgi:hypothetical protein